LAWLAEVRLGRVRLGAAGLGRGLNTQMFASKRNPF